MKVRVVVIAAIFAIFAVSQVLGLARPDMEFKIFQFPKDKIPQIDGNADDWAIVPDSYNIGVDQLKDTVHNTPIDKNDLDVNVKVGWVNGLNRLYFLYEAYDNFWDFNSSGFPNDIFEIHVDGDLSGGSFLPTSGMGLWEGYLFQGVYSQNYHIFTPAEGKPWTAVWGGQPWVAYLPWSNAAYSYNFKHGESGKLILEFYITPFDYAPYQGAASAIPSKLEENKIIGLSWSVMDYDHENASDYDGFYNLSQNTRMDSNASMLCAFRLMPLETQFHKPIEALWTWKMVDMDQRIIEFKDLSYGNITSWKWDFGDGTTSTEQNPTHKYSAFGMYNLVVLNVSGPDGTARMAKMGEAVPK
jgi:hypothetical protein